VETKRHLSVCRATLARPQAVNSALALLSADDQTRISTHIDDHRAKTKGAWRGSTPSNSGAKVVAVETALADEPDAPAKLAPPRMIIVEGPAIDRFAVGEQSSAELAFHIFAPGFRRTVKLGSLPFSLCFGRASSILVVPWGKRGDRMQANRSASASGGGQTNLLLFGELRASL
jgi:hypothetical protein